MLSSLDLEMMYGRRECAVSIWLKLDGFSSSIEFAPETKKGLLVRATGSPSEDFLKQDVPVCPASGLCIAWSL